MEPLSEQPYDSEPSRPELLVASSEPFNGEPPLSRLVKQYVTPTELFFVRNHSAVPSLDVTQHCVVLNGPGFLEQELSFSVADLFKFEQHTVTCALQCAGNRRRELVAATGKAVKGLAWGSGACGNASWSGVWLRDVLLAAGLFRDQNTASDGSDGSSSCSSRRATAESGLGTRQEIRSDGDSLWIVAGKTTPPVSSEAVARLHVAFEGADGVKEHNFKEGYGSSIPLARCLSLDWCCDDGGSVAGVMLATKMNGQPLTRDHGAPIRVVVPGVIGARSVKWLRKITVQPFESTNFFQERDYKLFPPHVDWDTVEPLWSTVRPVQEMNVQSVVCTVSPLAARPSGSSMLSSSSVNAHHQLAPLGAQWVAASGYALSGGGRSIERVDVSGDGGATWVTATLQHGHGNNNGRDSSGISSASDNSSSFEGHKSIGGKSYGWTLWSVETLAVVPQASSHPSSKASSSSVKGGPASRSMARQVVCRAWDEAGNTQPENAVWNLRGVMNNAWSRVDLLPTSQL